MEEEVSMPISRSPDLWARRLTSMSELPEHGDRVPRREELREFWEAIVSEYESALNQKDPSSFVARNKRRFERDLKIKGGDRETARKFYKAIDSIVFADRRSEDMQFQGKSKSTYGKLQFSEDHDHLKRGVLSATVTYSDGGKDTGTKVVMSNGRIQISQDGHNVLEILRVERDNGERVMRAVLPINTHSGSRVEIERGNTALLGHIQHAILWSNTHPVGI